MTWATISPEVLDGRRVVVKTTDYDARVEAEGLAALAAAGAPVPAVITVDPRRLVLAEATGPPDWESLGRALAACHRAGADRFGYRIDNFIGPLPQVNSWQKAWSSFYAERRLTPHLDSVPAALSARIRAAIDSGRLAALLDHGQDPSLVHGDLWSGNIVAGRWLIDPAVHFADRELDPAFAAVFGGIPASMWAAYEESWPLDDGWRERRPALQLYHLLVHARLFGGGYIQMVADRLDRLGW